MRSPHDPNILYTTGNFVFRSTDEGNSWDIISPDLTRNDVSTLEASGGPITKDNTGAEYYGTIFAFAESPLQRGLFWAGSDDGLVHISRDNGERWENVTPQELPEWALISIIEPSPHDPAAAYVAATRYKLDDFQPYLFKTSDYGKTWTKITSGIGANDFTRVVREDPQRRGLLYAGTETGAHVSFDDGDHWQALQLNLPVVPVHDLAVKDSDLVAATHGRSFWILDDVTPLRQVSEQLQSADIYLFKPRSAIRFITVWGFARTPTSGKFYPMLGGKMVTARREQKPGGEPVSRNLDAGQNPPYGVIVTYYLKQKPEGEVKLTFLDARGNEIKTFSSETGQEQSPNSKEALAASSKEKDKGKEKKEPRVSKEAGATRFVWDMRYPEARKIDGYVAADSALVGPAALPGMYQVQLTVGDQAYSEPFEIYKDPRVMATQADLEAQFELRLKIRDKLSEMHDAINMLRNIRQQIESWDQLTGERADHEALVSAGESLKEKLTAIEDELVQSKAKSRQDTLNFPAKLNAKLAALGAVIASADAAPTRQAYELFDDLATRIDVQLRRLQEVIDTDVAAFNSLMRELGVPALIPVTTFVDNR